MVKKIIFFKLKQNVKTKKNALCVCMKLHHLNGIKLISFHENINFSIKKLIQGIFMGKC